MSYADELYKKTCRDILENGFSDENLEVRPHWADGTPAHTIKKFGVVNRYNLAEEFPIMTLRRTYWKSAVDELLWIWQKKSNRVADLGSHVWDEWVGEDGTIGKQETAADSTPADQTAPAQTETAADTATDPAAGTTDAAQETAPAGQDALDN